MSPSNTPDFDNMSPEEMMRWMETLAKRQGADAEGFITDASADVVDPTDYDEADFGPGYTPYGEEKKPAASTPPPPPPPPAPEPPAAAPATGGMPDFDSMSPEEAMRWMETLAKRQGAAEGFTTSADAEVVDPTDYDEADFGPGYVPYGQEGKAPAQAPKAAAPPPPPPPEPAPAVNDDLSWLDSLAGGDDMSSASDLPDLSDLDSLTAELGGVLDADSGSQADDSLAWLEGLTGGAPEPTPTPPTPVASADFDPLSGDIDPLRWLESLAQKQGANPEELITGGGMDIPDMDPTTARDTGPGYSGYNVDNEGSGQQAEQAAAPDPNDWLSGLAGDSAPQAFPEDEDATDPAAWLGALANDQDVASRVSKFDPNPAPVSRDKPSTGDPIADMINSGETPPPEMMQAWMARKMDEMLSSDPLPIDEDDGPVTPADPSAPAVEADLPDWLQEMAPGVDSDRGMTDPIADDEDDMSELESLFTQSAAQAAPADTGMPDFLTDVQATEPGNEPSPLSDEINVPDMPSWLMEDVPQEGDSLDSVFAKFETSEADQPPQPRPTSIEVDPALLARLDPQRRAEQDDDDPWVDALDEAPDADFDASETLPEWYVEAMNDPDRIAEVETLSGKQLQIVELPEETRLPRGQREPIPDWLAYATGAATPPVTAPAPAAPAVVDTDDDMPDWLVSGADAAGDDLPTWLVEAGDDVAEQDMPDWLLETIDEEAAPVPVIDMTPAAPAPTPTPPPARQITPQEPKSPVPVTPEVAQIDVVATLQNARQRVQAADVEGGLMAYERVVRANASLNEVVADVSNIIKADRENAAAYRVLGDALMRQGKLQAALDTYRRALNLL